MKGKRILVLLVITCLMLCFTLPSWAAEKKNFPITPKDNNGKKWRIGYLEAGPYANYPDNLRALVEALAAIGWIEKIKLPPLTDRKDNSKLWPWLCQNVKSNYIEFARDGYWSANWDKSLRLKVKAQVIERLKKKDINLMLAMGTWAGQDLANNEHSVPTIVMSCSNPLASKIVKSPTDSGYDHLNARIDPTRYQRQLRIFHDIFKFKRLGVVYETNTDDGKSYAAINDINQVAKERGFKVITCHAPFSNVSEQEAKNAVLKCHQELAPQVDAFYITVHRGVTLENLPQLLQPLNARKIPTFSQLGSPEVEHGALLSIARSGFKYIARFHAETIAKIFNGAKPRELPQIFEDPPKIAINLQTAKLVGYNPPVDILSAADEIYEKTKKAEGK